MGLVDTCTAKEVVVELKIEEEQEGREVLEREEVEVVQIVYPQDDRCCPSRIRPRPL